MSTLELKLDKNVSIFAEVEDAPGARRQDVSTEQKLEANFSKVTGSLQAIAKMMEEQLKQIDRPDKVELEMGAQLKGAADLWLVSGEATGHMKIKLTWDKPKPNA